MAACCGAECARCDSACSRNERVCSPFQPIAEYFVSLGYVFCGNDHAGHGDSIQQADKKGFFAAENGWNALVDDVMTVHRRLKAEYPEAKQILYGHSMGSFIARGLRVKVRN